jgi:hypothetical protein
MSGETTRAEVLRELIEDTKARQAEPYDMPQWERWGLGARLEWLKRRLAQEVGNE